MVASNNTVVENEKKSVAEAQSVYLDAGLEHLHVVIFSSKGKTDLVLKNNDFAETLLGSAGLLDLLRNDIPAYVTGKMGEIVLKTLGYNAKKKYILPSASLQLCANKRIREMNNDKDGAIKSYGIIELSASGYTNVVVDERGELLNDLLVVNPKCGAGSGINLARILQKLDIKNEQVDAVLSDYLGETGKEGRQKVSVRADRCGVFSSSATISDKNQGIPLDYALAVTLKSEVLKACKKLSPGVGAVLLTGRVFAWQFARECAKDYLESIGKTKVFYDEHQTAGIEGMQFLVSLLGAEGIRNQIETKLARPEELTEYPSFQDLRSKFESTGHYVRISKSEQMIPTDISLTTQYILE